MRNYFQHLIWTIVLSTFAVCIALGGGYQFNEQGARASGMGGAFVARASDLSAIYYNPAGLAFQKGNNTLLGINFVLPAIKFKGAGKLDTLGETSTNSKVITPLNLYGAYRIDDDIIVGLGVYNPFSSGIEWPLPWGLSKTPRQWVGSSKALKYEMCAWYFNPSVAYKISDELSVGLGLSYVYATLYNKIELMQYDADGTGWNINAGVLYKPIEGLSVGISYRMNTNIEFDGSVKYAGGLETAQPDSIKLLPTYQSYIGGSGKAEMPLPGILSVGIAYEIMPGLTIEGDLQYIQWSEYDQLKLEITPSGIIGQKSITQTKRWSDAMAFRGGVEYDLTRDMTVRLGGALDLSPQSPSKTEPLIPDADRANISLGFSYKLEESYSIDFAYQYGLHLERNATAANSSASIANPDKSPNFGVAGVPGTYNGQTHTFSINLGYAF